MKKIVLSLALVALMLFGLVAAAEGIVPYGNPDTTLDNPQSLPYSSSFSFKEFDNQCIQDFFWFHYGEAGRCLFDDEQDGENQYQSVLLEWKYVEIVGF